MRLTGESSFQLLDRITGTLLATAAGDALGAPFEGGLVPSGPVEMLGGGPRGLTPGEWTDDTAMTICLAETAATGVDLRSTQALAAIGDSFLEWYHSRPPDIGATTQAVLSSAATGADLPALALDYYTRFGRSASNGALMRTAPVAFAHLGDDPALVEAAMAVAALTHADPVAGQSCAIWCIAIDRAIRENRIDGAWDALTWLPSQARDRWAKAIEEASRRPPVAFEDNWHTARCLQAALAAVLQAGHKLEDGIQAAVHAGADTDTVGAVAGALLGARWGASAVPDHWRSALHDRWGRTSADLVRLGEGITNVSLQESP